jgi:hypothetical protein
VLNEAQGKRNYSFWENPHEERIILVIPNNAYIYAHKINCMAP